MPKSEVEEGAYNLNVRVYGAVRLDNDLMVIHATNPDVRGAINVDKTPSDDLERFWFQLFATTGKKESKVAHEADKLFASCTRVCRKHLVDLRRK